MKRLILSTVCMLFCATGLWARTLVDGIYYDFDASTQTASVEEGVNKYSGDITIPLTVTYNGTSYSVTSIGRRAFSNCTGLTSVTIPNSVTSIENYAFSSCTGLTSINVAEDNLYYASIDGVLYSKDKKTLIKCPQGKTGSVTIPNSVTSIGNYAFDYCTGLTNITLPNSVTSIGNYAFYGCTGLTSMTVEATNPPSASYSIPSASYSIVSNYNIPLNVPAGSVDAYKTADVWKKFTNIQAIPGTSVNEATVENTVEKSEVKKIIDRNGIIYIEKDGTRYFLNGSKVK